MDEYRELAEIKQEAKEFLLGWDKAYGTMHNDGQGYYHLAIDIGSEKGSNIADRVSIMLRKAGSVKGSIIRDEIREMAEDRTDHNEIVRGLERCADTPGLPVQREMWTCVVEEKLVERLRKELSGNQRQQ